MNPIISEHDAHPLSLAKYISGFIGSVVLTLAAYLLVTRTAYSPTVIIGAISGLAILQFLVQMLFFLHVGDEHKPRWKVAVLFLMLGFVLILVIGSVWIMNNLNYRMTAPQVQQYLNSQDSL